MDPMTTIALVGIAVVGLEALLTAAVYRKAFRPAAGRRATAGQPLTGEAACLSDLRRQRLRELRRLDGTDRRPVGSARRSPAPAESVRLQSAA